MIKEQQIVMLNEEYSVAVWINQSSAVYSTLYRREQNKLQHSIIYEEVFNIIEKNFTIFSTGFYFLRMRNHSSLCKQLEGTLAAATAASFCCCSEHSIGRILVLHSLLIRSCQTFLAPIIPEASPNSCTEGTVGIDASGVGVVVIAQ